MLIRNVATRVPDAENLGTAIPCQLYKSPPQNVVVIFQTVWPLLVQYYDKICYKSIMMGTVHCLMNT